MANSNNRSNRSNSVTAPVAVEAVTAPVAVEAVTAPVAVEAVTAPVAVEAVTAPVAVEAVTFSNVAYIEAQVDKKSLQIADRKLINEFARDQAEIYYQHDRAILSAKFADKLAKLQATVNNRK